MGRDALPVRTFACSCGQVEYEARGEPILSGVCHCDDCQAAARVIEALPGAPGVTDPAGGTHYLTYRDDRLTCLKGASLLKGYTIKDKAPTQRFVASCCNAPMVLKFKWGHWTSTYAARYRGAIPPVEMRTQTQFARAGVALPDDAPIYKSFPPGLFARLIKARFAMWFGR